MIIAYDKKKIQKIQKNPKNKKKNPNKKPNKQANKNK